MSFTALILLLRLFLACLIFTGAPLLGGERETRQESPYYSPLSFTAFQDKLITVINARPCEKRRETDIPVFVEGRGEYGVDPLEALALLGKSPYEERLWLAAQEGSGTHRVVHKDGIHFKIDTMEDLDPAMESAIYLFYQTVFGRGVTPSCLLTFRNFPVKAAPKKRPDEPLILQDYRQECVNCGYNGQELHQWVVDHPDILPWLEDRTVDFAVQASQTVQGILLTDFMRKVETGEQQWENINTETVQEFLLGSLLTMAEDLKPDNVMLGEVAKNQFVMVGIDNDRSFAFPVVKTSTQSYMIQAKNCLLATPYLLDQALQPDVASKFLVSCEELIARWFKGLYEREHSYNKMIKSGAFFLSADGATPLDKKLQIPLRFVSGTVTGLFKRMRLLQDYLNAGKDYTRPALRDVFSHMDPLLAKYYQQLCQVSLSPLQRIQELYDPASSFKYILHVLHLQTKLQDGRTAREALTFAQRSFTDFIFERKETLTSAHDHFREVCQNAQKALMTLEGLIPFRQLEGPLNRTLPLNDQANDMATTCLGFLNPTECEEKVLVRVLELASQFNIKVSKMDTTKWHDLEILKILVHRDAPLKCIQLAAALQAGLPCEDIRLEKSGSLYAISGTRGKTEILGNLISLFPETSELVLDNNKLPSLMSLMPALLRLSCLTSLSLNNNPIHNPAHLLRLTQLKSLSLVNTCIPAVDLPGLRSLISGNKEQPLMQITSYTNKHTGDFQYREKWLSGDPETLLTALEKYPGEDILNKEDIIICILERLGEKEPWQGTAGGKGINLPKIPDWYNKLFALLQRNDPRPSAFRSLFALKYGLPRGTVLDSFTFKKYFLYQTSGLTSLTISDYPMNPVNLEFLKEFSSLTKLFLRGMKLVNLDALPRMPALMDLDLTNNGITSLKGLLNNQKHPKFPDLRTLILAKNQLTSDDSLKLILNSNYLTRLDLSTNYLKEVPKLGNLRCLNRIDLRENVIPDNQLGQENSKISYRPQRSNQSRSERTQKRFGWFF